LLYRILGRIFRRHFFLHLFIPLLIGVAVELIFWKLGDGSEPEPILSVHRIAGFVAIFLTYLVIVFGLIAEETNIHPGQLAFLELRESLAGAETILSIGTLQFHEWFDPAVQVYLATVYEQKLQEPDMQYDRVLLLGGSSAARGVEIDFLDGYLAKCLKEIHERLGISLYRFYDSEIRDVLGKLTPEERIEIGLLPKLLRYFPAWCQRLYLWLFWTQRLRKIAAAIIESNGAKKVVRFSKRDKVISLSPPQQSNAFVKLGEAIREQLAKHGPDFYKLRW
jgi:hypothetical protein